MRVVEIGLGEIGRIGRNQRQVKLMGNVDQPALACTFYGIERAGNLHIGTARKELEQPVGIADRRIVLPFGNQSRHSPLRTAGQDDQPFGMLGEFLERHVRRFLERTVEVRGRRQRAEIGIARLILRVECQPVIGRRHGVGPVRPGDRQQSTDNRLYAGRDTSLRKFHRAIEPVAIRDRGGGKAKFARAFRNTLGIDRAFEHRIGGQDSQGDEGRVRHGFVLGRRTAFGNCTGR